MTRINKEITREAFLPNTTQVPNVILDWMMAELSGAEFKVLMFFVRQRYGFNFFTGSFQYSIGEIMEGVTRQFVNESGEKEIKKVCAGTGLKKDAVLGALESLAGDGAIKIVARGNRKQVNTYQLGMFDLVGKNDKGLSEKPHSPSRKNRQELVGKNDNPLSEKPTLLGNQGETNRNQEEIGCAQESAHPTSPEPPFEDQASFPGFEEREAPPPVSDSPPPNKKTPGQQVVSFYWDRHVSETTRKPLIDFSAEVRIAERVMKKYSLSAEDLFSMLDLFFKDAYQAKRGYKLNYFYSSLNEYNLKREGVSYAATSGKDIARRVAEKRRQARETQNG